MTDIMDYQSDGSEYIEGIPARDILLTDWDALPADISYRGNFSGVYMPSTTEDAVLPISPESPPPP